MCNEIMSPNCTSRLKLQRRFSHRPISVAYLDANNLVQMAPDGSLHVEPFELYTGATLAGMAKRSGRKPCDHPPHIDPLLVYRL